MDANTFINILIRMLKNLEETNREFADIPPYGKTPDYFKGRAAACSDLLTWLESLKTEGV